MDEHGGAREFAAQRSPWASRGREERREYAERLAQLLLRVAVPTRAKAKERWSSPATIASESEHTASLSFLFGARSDLDAPFLQRRRELGKVPLGLIGVRARERNHGIVEGRTGTEIARDERWIR